MNTNLIVVLPAWCGALLLLAGGGLAEEGHHHDDHHAGDHHEEGSENPLEGERVVSLESTYEVKRDGTVDVEQRFVLAVQGIEIRRGPRLNFVTVFEGPAGLVLHNGMKVTGVFRESHPEEFSVREGDGQSSVYCGSEETFLEPGLHHYRVTYTTTGEWIYRDSEAMGAFDVTGPFRGLPIEAASMRLRFPEGVRLVQYSPAVQGAIGKGPGYEATLDGNELFVSVTSPLVHNHAFFVNAAWTTGSFASRSHWVEVLKQHPRLPLSLFAAVLLLWALILLLRRFQLRRSPVVAPA